MSYLMPPLAGSKCSEWTERHPVNVCILSLSLTPKFIVYVEFETLILKAKSGEISV